MPDLFPIIKPVLFALPPETAHGLTIRALRLGLAGADPGEDSPALATNVMGLSFANPIGLAAGFDKNAEVPRPMLRLGMGLVEVGTVTPLPQPGNPRPRIFRLPADQGVINRLGFNNQGLPVAKARLQGLARQGGVIGANIGANKDAPNRMEDYEVGLQVLYPHADYFTANISSPNTPGLRDLQAKAALDELLSRLSAVRTSFVEGGAARKPLVLKIAPDISEAEAGDIAAALLESDFDGLIVSNTTISREGLHDDPHMNEAGGLSGAPLFEKSTACLALMRRLTKGKIALIGAGGVRDGATAYAKIRAGASLVQLYTGMIYEGPRVIRRIKDQLTDLLAADGFTSVADAVGVDVDDK